MNRRHFIEAAALGLVPLVGHPSTTVGAVPPSKVPSAFSLPSFQWEEATVAQLQSAMESGRETALSLLKAYLERIEQVDRSGPAINSVIELNPDSKAIARNLDKERKSSGLRGPLHGIPVLIKDNIDTHDRMMTTAGSLALLGSIPPRDSFLVQQLRRAGVVIVGKTNLSEWANFRSTRATSGWSGRGGLTKNPYVLDRNASGSSSGTGAAIAANLSAVGIGTETDGSITSPASYNGLVGLKPTVGLVSRAGIIPISVSQDTAGPMTRSVADAAVLLGAITGIDPADRTTQKSSGRSHPDYTRFLDPAGLRGARLGVARQFFGLHPDARKVAESALEVLRDCGAVLVDPVEIETSNQFGRLEILVLHYEFKAGLNAYLKSLGSAVPVRTLADLIRFNEEHRAQEMPFFGQEIFLKAEEKGPLTDKPYLEALLNLRRLSREEGIDAVMDKHTLAAIIAPTTGPAHATDLVHGDRHTGGCTTPAAVAGYPHITVPAGEVSTLPVGLSFFGRAFSEPTLLKLAFAFEQATKARKPPRFLPCIAAHV